MTAPIKIVPMNDAAMTRQFCRSERPDARQEMIKVSLMEK